MITTITVVILLTVGMGCVRAQEDSAHKLTTSPKVELQQEKAAGRKIYPVDESHLDPSFAEFKARLLEAVERQDLDFLVSIAHPNIRLSIEGGSREELQKDWEIFNDNYSGRAWQDLRDMLSLGAVRNGSRFCAPYLYTTFPNDLEILRYVVITGSDVPIRAEAESTAPIIGHYSYDIVKYLWRGRGASVWDTIEGEKYQWLRIETPAGETGYVWGKQARRPTEETVCFRKVDGQWMMTSWIGWIP